MSPKVPGVAKIDEQVFCECSMNDPFYRQSILISYYLILNIASIICNKQIADRMGCSQIIEASGAKIAADTCPVVAPIRGRFKVMATDSAKGCYYVPAKDGFKTVYRSFEEVVAEALRQRFRKPVM